MAMGSLSKGSVNQGSMCGKSNSRRLQKEQLELAVPGSKLSPHGQKARELNHVVFRGLRSLSPSLHLSFESHPPGTTVAPMVATSLLSM